MADDLVKTSGEERAEIIEGGLALVRYPEGSFLSTDIEFFGEYRVNWIILTLILGGTWVFYGKTIKKKLKKLLK